MGHMIVNDTNVACLEYVWSETSAHDQIEYITSSS